MARKPSGRAAIVTAFLAGIVIARWAISNLRCAAVSISSRASGSATRSTGPRGSARGACTPPRTGPRHRPDDAAANAKPEGAVVAIDPSFGAVEGLAVGGCQAEHVADRGQRPEDDQEHERDGDQDRDPSRPVVVGVARGPSPAPCTSARGQHLWAWRRQSRQVRPVRPELRIVHLTSNERQPVVKATAAARRIAGNVSVIAADRHRASRVRTRSRTAGIDACNGRRNIGRGVGTCVRRR